MRTVLILMVTALLTGCGGSYQVYHDRWNIGGYNDFQLDDNVFIVRSIVSGWHKPELARRHFDRRAKELCAQAGYTNYIVYPIEKKDYEMSDGETLTKSDISNLCSTRVTIAGSPNCVICMVVCTNP